MSRAPLFFAVAIALLIGACGSSKHAATSLRTSLTSTSATSTGSGATASTSASTTGTATSSRSTSSTRTATSSSSSPVPTNARVPATFRIRAGGTVDPGTVSAPARLAVQLTVVSADGRLHHAVLRTVIPYSLTIPANGRASVLVPGQRAGRYALDVDGAPRAFLLIGPEPGP